MKKDFCIKHTSVEITYRDQVYDIHNCYEFVGLRLSFLNGTRLEILFDKIEREWIKASDPTRIIFVFQSVKYFELSKNFVVGHSSTIEELGYKDLADYDYNWLLSEEHFTGDQHFIFSFEGSEFIRASGDTVELITEFSKEPRTLYQ